MPLYVVINALILLSCLYCEYIVLSGAFCAVGNACTSALSIEPVLVRAHLRVLLQRRVRQAMLQVSSALTANPTSFSNDANAGLARSGSSALPEGNNSSSSNVGVSSSNRDRSALQSPAAGAGASGAGNNASSSSLQQQQQQEQQEQ